MSGSSQAPGPRSGWLRRLIAWFRAEKQTNAGRLLFIVIGSIVGVIIVATAAAIGVNAAANGGGSGDGHPSRGPSTSTSVASPAAPPSSATTAPTASGGGTGTSGNGGSAAIYHQGTLTLAFNTCVDLDAPPSDPQWGVSASYYGGAVDLCSESPSFVGINGATLVTVKSGTDSTCQNATGWLPTGGYQNLHLSVGSFLCVHTNQDRYSLLSVKAINSTSYAMTFSVKTFNSP